MPCVLVADIIDSEIINYQREADRASLVFPESRRGGALEVDVVIEAPLEQLLCNNTSVW